MPLMITNNQTRVTCAMFRQSAHTPTSLTTSTMSDKKDIFEKSSKPMKPERFCFQNRLVRLFTVTHSRIIMFCSRKIILNATRFKSSRFPRNFSVNIFKVCMTTCECAAINKCYTRTWMSQEIIWIGHRNPCNPASM
jgi:hypothetical protein